MRGFLKSQSFSDDAHGKIRVNQQAFGLQIDALRNECLCAHADGQRRGPRQAPLGAAKVPCVIADLVPLREVLLDESLKAVEALHGARMSRLPYPPLAVNNRKPGHECVELIAQ